jgi:hypothetical protein
LQVIIAPWVIEALGFAELGPLEGMSRLQCCLVSAKLTYAAGSFASWWQSTYGGLVPKGSLFSFFQRLGMVWH